MSFLFRCTKMFFCEGVWPLLHTTPPDERSGESRGWWWKNIKLWLLNGNTDLATTKKNKPKPLHLEKHKRGETVLWSLFFKTFSGNSSLFLKESSCAPFPAMESALSSDCWAHDHTPQGWLQGRQQEVAQPLHSPNENLPMSSTLMRCMNWCPGQQNLLELTGGLPETKD